MLAKFYAWLLMCVIACGSVLSGYASASGRVADDLSTKFTKGHEVGGVWRQGGGSSFAYGDYDDDAIDRLVDGREQAVGEGVNSFAGGGRYTYDGKRERAGLREVGEMPRPCWNGGSCLWNSELRVVSLESFEAVAVKGGGNCDYDTNNHTGYAQVVEETDAATGDLQSVFVYGHDLISQDRVDNAGNFAMSFYSYDGLGSVRGLTDAIGTSLGQYHYDAYGLLIENTVSVANPYLFAGERFDNDLGLYYLRARYLDVETGRFHTLDTYEGRGNDPLTLHKYLYAHSNPVSGIDPTGNSLISRVTAAIGMAQDLALNIAARGAILALRKPIWTFFITFIVNAAIPQQVHDALMMSGIPAAQVPASAKRMQIGLVKQIRRLFGKGLSRSITGALSKLLGEKGFEGALEHQILQSGITNKNFRLFKGNYSGG